MDNKLLVNIAYIAVDIVEAMQPTHGSLGRLTVTPPHPSRQRSERRHRSESRTRTGKRTFHHRGRIVTGGGQALDHTRPR